MGVMRPLNASTCGCNADGIQAVELYSPEKDEKGYAIAESPGGLNFVRSYKGDYTAYFPHKDNLYEKVKNQQGDFISIGIQRRTTRGVLQIPLVTKSCTLSICA